LTDACELFSATAPHMRRPPERSASEPDLVWKLGSSRSPSLHPPPPPDLPRTASPKSRHNRFSDLLSASIIDLDRIRDLSWAGIPTDFRATVWRLFLDYEPVNSAIRSATLEHKRSDYFDCVERVFSEAQRPCWTNSQRQTESQIMRDLPRTHIPLLRNERVQLLFRRVLFVWSVRHPASGYVQGMNDLLQPFFFAFLPATAPIETVILSDRLEIADDDLRQVEADCFWCFSKLLDGLQDLYTKDQPGLYKMLEKLEDVIDRVSPQLGASIHNEDIQYQEFAFRWMNCLLVREFGVAALFRLWDSYLSNHSKIASTHVYVCAAMMVALAPKLTGLSHAEFVMQVQAIKPDAWTLEQVDTIIAQAYVYEKMFANSSSHLKSKSK
jgi:hypothetical protein